MLIDDDYDMEPIHQNNFSNAENSLITQEQTYTPQQDNGNTTENSETTLNSSDTKIESSDTKIEKYKKKRKPRPTQPFKKISQCPFFSSSEPKFVLDFEGVYSKKLKTLVLRELCILNLQTMKYTNYIIENDSHNYPEEKNFQKDHTEQSIHHIPDYYSNVSAITFQELADLLTLLSDRFISKGYDKSIFLSRKFMAYIINVEDYGCPPYLTLSEMYPSVRYYCQYHNLSSNFHCSVFKSHLIAEFIKQAKKY